MTHFSNCKTIEDLKASVKTFLTDKAYTETIRPIIENIKKETLMERSYFVGKENVARAARRSIEGRITEIGQAYLMSEEDAQYYYSVLDAKYKAAGFVFKPDCCPLLCAESTQLDCTVLIEKYSLYIAIASGMVEAEFKRALLRLEFARKWQDLVLSMVFAKVGKEYFL